MNLTRRDWILAAACWTEALRAQAGQRFAWFEPSMAAEIEAIAATIIPDDETPGAGQAGVIRFIDQALAGYDADKRELYHRGLADTQMRRAELFPGSTSIASLAPDQRIRLLQAMEDSEFFRQVRFHTILGFLGHPMHGGNRGGAGWKLLGIDYAMHYEPPFGYYDAEQAPGDAK
ncbi:MAG: hypothetical protein C5B51_10140 [Terriglobia bacterium]|nr:MAG: hypothetical protein C5B51_10140 [Terriglobia bacterium]